MALNTLFDLESTPKKKPYKPRFKIPKVGRTPHPRTCPKCHRTILIVLADNLIEERIDPLDLPPTSRQAATYLKIPIYRAPHREDGPPGEYWWTHPLDPPQPGEYYSPQHQCGKPHLPGQPIPTKPPTTNHNQPTNPPF